MMMNRKQEKSIEILSFLEEIALEKGMRIWIIDNIREVKGELEKELSETELEKNLLRIDEILQYMKQQITAETIGEVAVDELTTVSFDDIRERMQEIIQECETANESLCRQGVYNQQEYIRETERKIRDINNVDAFYQTVCSGDRFRNYFHQAGMRLNQQIQKSLVTYVEETLQNYNQAVGKIKGLFFHIKEENLHVSQRKFYQSWENKYNLEKQTIKAKAETMDCGGTEISTFGQKHFGKINEIIENLNKKKKKYMWGPFLVATAIFLLVSAFNLSEKIIEQKNMQQSTVTEEDTDDKTGVEGIIDFLKDIPGAIFGNEVVEKTTSTLSNIILLVVILIVVPLFLLIVVFPYMIYLSRLKRWYKKWVCTEVGEYLGTAIDELITESAKQQNVEEAYFELKEEIKMQCRGTLENILNQTKINEIGIKNNDAERFSQICLEWETIKREA